MKKYLIISLVVLFLLLVVIGGYAFYKTLIPNASVPPIDTTQDGGKCGDGICDAEEKTKGICPKDCENDIIINAPTGGNISGFPYYVITIHVNPVNIKGTGSATADETLSGFYLRTKQEVDYANKYNIKLSLWFSVIMADYVSKNPDKLAEVKKWMSEGHEIGLHHHSTYRDTDWDGYTFMTKEEALTVRRSLGDFSDNYKGTMEDMMNIIKKLNPNVKSGVNSEQYDKKDAMPDEIIYSTGSGYSNYGEAGIWAANDKNINVAVNEFISTSLVNGIERKWLTHFDIGTKENLQIAEDKFNTLGSEIVFSVITHNSLGNVKAVQGFIDFLHSKDPVGKNSRTVSQIMESNIIPEREIQLRCENLNGVICEDKGCSGNWLINEETFKCCSSYCVKEKNSTIIDTESAI